MVMAAEGRVPIYACQARWRFLCWRNGLARSSAFAMARTTSENAVRKAVLSSGSHVTAIQGKKQARRCVASGAETGQWAPTVGASA